MPLLVFRPRAGAFGASAILPLCAQLLWCEWFDMKDDLQLHVFKADATPSLTPRSPSLFLL